MIKRALVYAYGNTDHDNTYRAAANFALQFDCELTGVFVTPDYMNYTSVYGPGPINLAQHYDEMQKEFGAAAKERFTEITDKIGCNAQWHNLSEFEAQTKPSMYTDIIFVSQPKVEKSVIFNDIDFVDNFVIDTGIPVIVIPQGWTQDTFGCHPLLGWKESREAVSATRHALPLMRAATMVDIVTIVSKFSDKEDLIAGVEISTYLAMHGVECNFQSVTKAADDRNDALTLKRHAFVNGCDLIIIGGYGHSRLREIILGGVTRGLIRKSEVPVLLAH
jgi:nucleotide-binding universal stress UspA family protein